MQCYHKHCSKLIFFLSGLQRSKFKDFWITKNLKYIWYKSVFSQIRGHWGKCCRIQYAIWGSVSMRSLSILSLFCAHSVSQNQVKAPPFIFPSLSLRVSVFLSTLITSLRQLKQCKPRKGVQIYQYANRFTIVCFHLRVFSKPAKSLKKSGSVSLSDETPPLIEPIVHRSSW